MKLIVDPQPFTKALEESPPDTDWDWAVRGELHDSALLGVEPTPGNAAIVLLTAGDTEARVFDGVPDRWLLPMALSPTVIGCALPRALVSQNTSTWSDVLLAAGWITWVSADQAETKRPCPALAPKPWRTASAAERRVISAALRAMPVTSKTDAIALEAGWLQLLDDLDASHQCSQSIEGEGRHQAGDYWHAVMHRREPDYGNSKYWFHQFSSHPVFPKLVEEVPRVADQFRSSAFDAWTDRLTAGGVWRPKAFVDCCQTAVATDDKTFRSAVEELQYREMLLLLRQTALDAAGR